MQFFIFPVLIFAVNAFDHFDFVEKSLKLYVNHTSDPCENFYRHVCPIGSPQQLISDSFKPLRKFIADTQKDYPWKHAEIEKDSQRFATWEDTNAFSDWNGSFKDFLVEFAESTCEVGDNLFWNFLERFYQIQENQPDSFNKLRSQIGKVDRCTTVLPILKFALDPTTTETVKNAMFNFSTKIGELIYNLDSVHGHMIVDVRDGILAAKRMINQMKITVGEEIEKTEWALKNNLTEAFDNITEKLNLHDNLEKDFETVLTTLFEIEKAYLSCKKEFSRIDSADLFCYIYQTFTSPKIDTTAHFVLYDNAFTNYPEIVFGLPNYYQNQYGNELSAKLGYTGFTAGHKIGQILIDNDYHLQYNSFFFETAQECVQNQYNRTCEYFREESCSVNDGNFKNNGADIVGLQLAYKLLETSYGPSLSDTIQRLNVTHEQLFFYAFALPFCSGSPQSDVVFDTSHSPANIRVNAAAQHLGFQTAFHCDASSRMMESAINQCHIFTR